VFVRIIEIAAMVIVVISRRVDIRGEMGHWPQQRQSSLISLNMDVHSVRPPLGQKGGGGMYICTE
jgi:hypothetical protein